jgi:ribosomal protein L29
MCSDSVNSFPLQHKCKEAGLNARIVDAFVWERLKTFMKNPNLILKQAERFLNKKHNTLEVSKVSVEDLNKEINKLKNEEDRYSRAYGAEAISLEQLQEYTKEIKEKITSLRGQILYLEQQTKQSQVGNMPTREEVENFCQKAKNMLNYLNFEERQRIILEVIEKITGNKEEVLVEGYLPLNDYFYVAFHSEYRNSVNTIRHDNTGINKPKLIPFSFKIKLPPPRYERIIMSRDESGRILESVAPKSLR